MVLGELGAQYFSGPPAAARAELMMRSLIVCVYYFGRWEAEKPAVFLHCRSALERAARRRAKF